MLTLIRSHIALVDTTDHALGGTGFNDTTDSAGGLLPTEDTRIPSNQRYSLRVATGNENPDTTTDCRTNTSRAGTITEQSTRKAKTFLAEAGVEVRQQGRSLAPLPTSHAEKI